MLAFFDYRSPYREQNIGDFLELNIYEKVIPFIVLFTLIYVLYLYRNRIKENEVLDKRIRIIGGVLLTIVYLSHYLLRFNLYGFDSILLPFQLCSISMFLAIILIFTKNRTIFAFVFYAGILGAFISYLTPILGYNSAYYRYYQFYIAHGLLILAPIYFLLVYDYIPTLRETVYAFAILQSLAIFMGIFNYFNDTDFMFIFVDPDKVAKFPSIQNFGGIPFYLIWVELTAVAAFAIVYILIDKTTKRSK